MEGDSGSGSKSDTGVRAARVGLIGDYDPEVRAHVAIPLALALASREEGRAAEAEWVATSSLGDFPYEWLARFDALWCVPASPYANMEGALGAIRFARERRVPFLGTCGGFQHAVIEYARNVLGHAEAEHAETSPEAAMPLVAPLACALVGARGRVRFAAGSRVRRSYGAEQAVEEYNCSYGFNPRYLSLLESGGMRVTGADDEGGVRAVELPGHPFFVATLFQPERSAFGGRAHPLVRAFVRAASGGAEQ
ncbi:MAG TPA: CTP synthase [Pyrinomonadaceae bacterium]|jgi:CTP synthase (UTP-ammonia lyase)